VREMATSGRDVQLALAPAGTGKTTAMQVLTRAWQDSGGTVIGLAPSAVAAQELGASINPENGDGGTGDKRSPLREPWRQGRKKVRADTLAKLVWHARHGAAPAWMEKIDDKTLVLIDEAGMAGTTDLAAAIDYITAHGGQVRLVGDDRQLASVAAGGVLRDIAHQVGAVTLSEVHRFRNPDGSLNHAEAAATLALREGDPSAIAFYADRGRIHVGDLGACADQAYAAWAADRAAGTDSVLIAPTRDLVAELNTRARNDRIAGLPDQPIGDQVGPVLTLADHTLVSAGDRVITRENDRLLPITKTDWVKNGDRWTVTRVNADGSLTVVHDRLRKTITLPADYVANTVQLGYATTVHGAQGITTGTCHVVLTGEEDRNLLYVALSRGRYANHLYLNVASDGDPHNLIRPEALIPPTALDRIADMLRRDGSPVSATTTLREQTNPHQLLGELAGRYHDAVTAGAENLIGTVGMAKIDAHAEALLSGLTEAPAWPTLRSHLALLALDGHSPLKLLDAAVAVAVGSLADARDPAAVLDARVDDLAAARPHDENTPAAAAGPVPWLPGIPARLADNLDWGPFLASYHQRVGDQVATVGDLARGWTGATAPPGRSPSSRTQTPTCGPTWPCGAPSPTPPRPTCDPPESAPSAPPAPTSASSTGPCARHVPATPSRSAAGTRRYPRPSGTTPGSPRCASGSHASNAPGCRWPTTSPRPSRPTPPTRPASQTPRPTRGRCPTSTRPRPCGGAWSRTSGRPRWGPTSTPRTCSSPPGARRSPSSSAPPRPTTCSGPPPGPLSSPRSTKPASTTAGLPATFSPPLLPASPRTAASPASR
jgi:hypothetical protein